MSTFPSTSLRILKIRQNPGHIPRVWTLPHLLALLPVALLLWAFCLSNSAQASDPTGLSWQMEEVAPGLRLHHTPRDAPLARKLKPLLATAREELMNTLRLYPNAPLEVWLAPDSKTFQTLTGGNQPASTLGTYQLGRGIIVLATPRASGAAFTDITTVLRHELVHAVLDQGIPEPIPLWLHEGMAVQLAGGLDFLDESALSVRAALDTLPSLAQLMGAFPQGHGARTLAYIQAASFARYLLRRGGMGGLRSLVRALGRGMAPELAFQATYGEGLLALEAQWRQKLSDRFSWWSLISTSSLLGGIGLPLLLLGRLRRWRQQRAKYRAWEAEEALQLEILEQANDPAKPAEEEGPPSGLWN